MTGAVEKSPAQMTSMARVRVDSQTEPKEQQVEKTSKVYRIPKKNRLVDMDSDEEDLGHRKVFLKNSSKFPICNIIPIGDFVDTSNLIPDKVSSLSKDLNRLIINSSTQQTWNRHCSALKLYAEFCTTYKIRDGWPSNIEIVRAFTTWAITKKSLKSSTVKSYISSLSVSHALGNSTKCNFNVEKCIKMLLKGAENIQSTECLPKPTRLAMNVDLLSILGHKISLLNWSDFSKQVLWTACTVCFYSSCRMGELLCSNEKSFDPRTTFLWENVMIHKEKDCVLFIPYTKTTGFEGKLVDIFPLYKDNKCPCAALARLKCLAEFNGCWDLHKPVFSFKSGKGLSKQKMNFMLSNLLGEYEDDNHRITGHSFRAAIPSALASFPDKSKITDIMEWGGWEGMISCKKYAKLDRQRKKLLFQKIVNCL